MKKLLILALFSLNTICLGMARPWEECKMTAAKHYIQTRDVKTIRSHLSGDPTRYTPNQREELFKVAKEAHSPYNQTIKSITGYVGYGLIAAGTIADFRENFNCKNSAQSLKESSFMGTSIEYIQWLIPKLLFMTGVYLLYKRHKDVIDEDAIIFYIDSQRERTP